MSDTGVKIIVAIDIGTSYSGYAYSFVDNPDHVTCSSFDGRTKTPTSVLVEKGKKLAAFGEEAERRFQLQTGNDGCPVYTLFRNFKPVTLNNEYLSKNTSVRDVSTLYSAPVFDLYVMTLHYLKNHAMRIINRHVDTYNEDDVRFVILVPTIADDRSKWFVRQAAIKAEVRPERLFIALESEAASVWYQRLNKPVPVSPVGTKYVMLDIGGGLVDISVHESAGNGHVESLCPPSGGLWGSINVDKCFISFIELVFGVEALKTFTSKHPEKWMKLVRKYEAAVQYCNADKGITLDIPVELLDTARDMKGLAAGESLVPSQALRSHISLQGTKLAVDAEVTVGLFQYTINSLCTETERLINMCTTENKSIDHVIVAGGLAGSEILQERLKQQLNRHSVGFTDVGNTFALKGAVLLGHDKSLVNSRVLPLTYALHNTVPYDTKRHEGGATSTVNGLKMCTENFHPLVRIGTKVKSGTELCETDMPLRATDKEHVYFVVSCGLVPELPMLVTHHCVHRETSFPVPLPFGCQVEDKVFDRVTILGDTELYFKIKFKKGNKATYIRYLDYK